MVKSCFAILMCEAFGAEHAAFKKTCIILRLCHYLQIAAPYRFYNHIYEDMSRAIIMFIIYNNYYGYGRGKLYTLLKVHELPADGKVINIFLILRILY